MKRGAQNAKSSIEVGDVTFAAGYVIRYLEDYARLRSLPAVEFALGVAGLVRATAIGQVLGSEDSLPSLRRSMPQRNKAVEPVAVAKRSYRPAPIRLVRKKATWTPKRRREYALRMKRNQAILQAARGRAA